MTDTNTALHRVREITDELAERNEATSVTVTVIPARDVVVIQLSRLAIYRCWRCGQTLHTRPGPVDWIDERTDGSHGGWDHQHGCGAWNRTHEEIVQVHGQLTGALDRLTDTCAEAHSAAAATIWEDLADALAAAVERIAADPDDDRWRTGSETEPGVYRRDDGILEAWDYHPAGTGDTITVVGE